MSVVESRVREVDDSTEPRLRILVADCLGVGIDEIAPETSLTDDLAVDSLDLVAIAVDAEAAFGITLSDRALGSLSTYRDLVETVRDQVARQSRRFAAEDLSGVPVLARVSCDGAATSLERIDHLTPYFIETLTEDARRSTAEVRVELTVPPDTSDGQLAAIHEKFAEAGGIVVTVAD
jgi:acyl carrier protein